MISRIMAVYCDEVSCIPVVQPDVGDYFHAMACEGDDTVAPRHPLIVHQRAILTPFGAGGVQAQ